MLPIGLRSRNPGNLRAVGAAWQGQTGVNEKGFCIFDTYANGIRALCKQLMIYQTAHGIYTVREAINRWAPPSENNTGAYVTAVCTMLDCTPNDRFNFRDDAFLFWMATAIGLHENGHAFFDHVSDADIDAGVAAALT